MITEEIRSYEVSIWTLQDEFITVLKWSDMEHKGRIQHPSFSIGDDGMETFTFSIPMYYDNGWGTLIENPIWYNTRNCNIMVNLRKVKVIFNKHTTDEAVFEFIITKIVESHVQDILTCEVSCEGLAFHELGKIGYKYDLSQELYELDYNAAIENGEPIPPVNIQYWCEKINLEPFPTDPTAIINPKKWYYELTMDWSSFEDAFHRSSSTMYEEVYTSAWALDNDIVTPAEIEPMREKERLIDVQESNIYNITQEIAKQFGVYCRYEYLHDTNYHIIGRKVVFFNQYLQDKHIGSFTYPYSSKSVNREIDSTDVITKMYVRSMSDDTTYLGEANISYCKANKMREDYILNFDYLKGTDAITKEQAEAIDVYETEIFKINEALLPLYDIQAAYEKQKVDLEAKVTTYTNSIALEMEQINTNSALSQELVAKYAASDEEYAGGNYIGAINETNPDSLVIIQNREGVYCVNLNSTKKGIRSDSIHIYRKYDIIHHELSEEINKQNYYFSYDEYGNPTTIFGIAPTEDSARIFLTYVYEPRLYYDNIIAAWKEKLGHDQQALLDAQKALDNKDDQGNDIEPYGLYTLIENLENEIKDYENQKAKLISDFNTMMGPALREGYWQPENYADYSEKHEGSANLNYIYDTQFARQDTDEGFAIGWDTELFDNEQPMFFTSGVNMEYKYYPCINLSTVFDDFQALLKQPLPVSVFFNNTSYIERLTMEEFLTRMANNKVHDKDEFYIYNSSGGLDLCTCFSEYNTETHETQISYTISQYSLNPANLRSFTIGSEAILAFIKAPRNSVTNQQPIIPALILIGAKGMSEQEVNFMYEYGNLSIGIVETQIEDKNISLIVHSESSIYIGKQDRFWTFNNIDTRKYKVLADGRGVTYFDVDTDNKDVPLLQSAYSRIKFSSLMLKADNGLFIQYNGNLLSQYEDYYINTKTLEERNYTPEYFVTLKPTVLMKQTTYLVDKASEVIEIRDDIIKINYLLSNASTAIYLDALKIAKENAFPKVAYTVEPNVLDKLKIRTLYNKLATLVQLNDVQLKFKNVFGYISHITLDLDQPQNDQIELKNYTSKFEDIFSAIVAQTESMQRNEGLLGPISRGVYSLSPMGLKGTLENNESLMLDFLANKFLPSQQMSDYLSSIFSEAGNILSDSNNTLNQVQSISSTHSPILSGFAQQVQSEMVPTIFRQETKPETFKQGDIWIEIKHDAITGEDEEIARYTATCNSINSKPGYGWTKTYGGSIAAIAGENMTFDAASEQVTFTDSILSSDGLVSGMVTDADFSFISSLGLLLGTREESDLNFSTISNAIIDHSALGTYINKQQFVLTTTDGNDFNTNNILMNANGLNLTSFLAHPQGALLNPVQYVNNITGNSIIMSKTIADYGNTTININEGETPPDPNGYIQQQVIISPDNIQLDGPVYIHTLMVYDPTNNEADSNGYVKVDLTGNFRDAISYISGDWNGAKTKFTATFSLFNSAITKDVLFNVNLEQTAIVLSAGQLVSKKYLTKATITSLLTIENEEAEIEYISNERIVDATAPYKAGFSAACNDIKINDATPLDEYTLFTGQTLVIKIPDTTNGTRTITIRA